LRKKTLSILLAVFYLAACTFLLTLPGSKFPKVTWMDKIPLFDKWVHIGLFALLTFLWCRAMPQYVVKTFLFVATACLLYGIAMEFVQGNWIPNRGFEVWDIIADATGCLIGFVFSRRKLLAIR
jgi:VanZ family protein